LERLNQFQKLISNRREKPPDLTPDESQVWDDMWHEQVVLHPDRTYFPLE
jgi:hypothetical protein